MTKFTIQTPVEVDLNIEDYLPHASHRAMLRDLERRFTDYVMIDKSQFHTLVEAIIEMRFDYAFAIMSLAAPHLDILDKRKIPQRYLLQMQWQMACTGRAWCDFVSFHPDFPSPHDLFLARVLRDDALIAAMEAEVQAFLHELDGKLATLKAQMEATHV